MMALETATSELLYYDTLSAPPTVYLIRYRNVTQTHHPSGGLANAGTIFMYTGTRTILHNLMLSASSNTSTFASSPSSFQISTTSLTHRASI